MTPPGSPATPNALRRLKKREHDRRAQRAARERTKKRIAQLEATVDTLSQQGSNDYNADLLDQLAAVSKERDELANIFAQVDKVMQKYTGRAHFHRVVAENVQDLNHNIDQQPEQLCNDWLDILTENPTAVTDNAILSQHHDRESSEAVTNQGIRLTTTQMEDVEPTTLNPSALLNPAIQTSTTCEPAELILPPAQSACDCTPCPSTTMMPVGQQNIWRSANVVLSGSAQVSSAILEYEDEISEDTAIRAVLEGWNMVKEKTQLSPFWRKLELIDRLQFSRCHPQERLAILTTMHRLLRYHATPTVEQYAKLPTWLRERKVNTLVHYCRACECLTFCTGRLK